MTPRGDRVTAAGPETHGSRCGPGQKKCGACGELFSCGVPEPSCWCEGVNLSPAALEKLRARYADCLCPRCLAAVALGAPKVSV
jgi:hypothetical protein